MQKQVQGMEFFLLFLCVVPVNQAFLTKYGYRNMVLNSNALGYLLPWIVEGGFLFSFMYQTVLYVIKCPSISADIL